MTGGNCLRNYFWGAVTSFSGPPEALLAWLSFRYNFFTFLSQIFSIILWSCDIANLALFSCSGWFGFMGNRRRISCPPTRTHSFRLSTIFNLVSSCAQVLNTNCLVFKTFSFLYNFMDYYYFFDLCRIWSSSWRWNICCTCISFQRRRDFWFWGCCTVPSPSCPFICDYRFCFYYSDGLILFLEVSFGLCLILWSMALCAHSYSLFFFRWLFIRCLSSSSWFLWGWCLSLDSSSFIFYHNSLFFFRFWNY